MSAPAEVATAAGRVAGLVPGHSAPGALDLLEAEAIHVLREAAGQFDRPALLFSERTGDTIAAALVRRLTTENQGARS